MNKIISYYGSKFKILDEILDIIKQAGKHIVFCDVFGGSGIVILNKPTTHVNVYNDIDSSLYNLFKVFMDDQKRRALIALLEITPHSREQFLECKNIIDNKSDQVNDVELARCVIVCQQQSFAKKGDTFGINRGPYNLPQQFANHIENVVKNILLEYRKFTIENLDYKDIFKKYDAETSLLYCDSPYYGVNKSYKHEFTKADHIEYLNLLRVLKSKVIVSGYHSDLYDDKLSDWNMKEINTNSQANFGENKAVIECVWCNFELNRDNLLSEIKLF